MRTEKDPENNGDEGEEGEGEVLGGGTKAIVNERRSEIIEPPLRYANVSTSCREP